MIEQERILDVYGSISVKTGEMVDAAKNSDWDRLVALERDCHALVESLHRGGASAGSGADARFVERKLAIIRKVLADDAEIRKLTEPWMAKLEAYLGNARRDYMLRRAYETDHGGQN